ALKQVRLVRLADPAFAAELERDLEAAGARAAGSAPGPRAWIHGDLHPLQVLGGGRLGGLDWGRARRGGAAGDRRALAAPPGVVGVRARVCGGRRLRRDVRRVESPFRDACLRRARARARDPRLARRRARARTRLGAVAGVAARGGVVVKRACAVAILALGLAAP